MIDNTIYYIKEYYTDGTYYFNNESQYNLYSLKQAIQVLNKYGEIVKDDEDFIKVELYGFSKLIKTYYCNAYKKKLILKVHNDNNRNNMLMNWYKNENPVEFLDDVWYEIKGFMGINIDYKLLNHPLKSLTSLMEQTLIRSNILSINEWKKLSRYKKKYIDDKSIDIVERKQTLLYLINKYE